MPSEKAVGSAFVVIGIIIIGIFVLWGILPFVTGTPVEMFEWSEMNLLGLTIPIPPLYWLLFVPIFLAVLLLCLILIWIGVTLVRLPAPEEIDVEKLEKELEEELKKEEEKIEKEEKPEEKK